MLSLDLKFRSILAQGVTTGVLISPDLLFSKLCISRGHWNNILPGVSNSNELVTVPPGYPGSCWGLKLHKGWNIPSSLVCWIYDPDPDCLVTTCLGFPGVMALCTMFWFCLFCNGQEKITKSARTQVCRESITGVYEWVLMWCHIWVSSSQFPHSNQTYINYYRY